MDINYPQQINLFGTPIHSITYKDTYRLIFKFIDDFRIDGQPRQIATANVNFLVNTQSIKSDKKHSDLLLNILRKADIVTADGMPLVWASRFLGCPIPERVAGSDMTPYLIEQCAKKGYSVYFLGGAPGTVERLTNNLNRKYPELNIAGYSSPIINAFPQYPELEDKKDVEVVQKINKTKPDILFVALGNPKQEIWIHRNLHRLKVPVSIGVGGTFEFMCGITRRAPIWIQKIGLEWIHRILQDPKRLIKRYANDLVVFIGMFLPLVIINKISSLRIQFASKNYHKRNLEIKKKDEKTVISLSQCLTYSQLDEIFTSIEQSNKCVIDFKGVSYIDNTYASKLIAIAHRFDETKSLSVINICSKLNKYLTLYRIDDLHYLKQKSRQISAQAPVLFHE